jgi:hypothetical protein
MTPIRHFGSAVQIGRAIALRRQYPVNSETRMFLDALVERFDEQNMCHNPRVEEILRKLESFHVPFNTK